MKSYKHMYQSIRAWLVSIKTTWNVQLHDLKVNQKENLATRLVGNREECLLVCFLWWSVPNPPRRLHTARSWTVCLHSWDTWRRSKCLWQPSPINKIWICGKTSSSAWYWCERSKMLKLPLFVYHIFISWILWTYFWTACYISSVFFNKYFDVVINVDIHFGFGGVINKNSLIAFYPAVFLYSLRIRAEIRTELSAVFPLLFTAPFSVLP